MDETKRTRWFQPTALGVVLIGAGLMVVLTYVILWHFSSPCPGPVTTTSKPAWSPFVFAVGGLALLWGIVLCLTGRLRRWMVVYAAVMIPVMGAIAASESLVLSRIKC